jgi:hypothetical protein
MMKSKLLLAGLAAVALVVAATQITPRARRSDRLEYDYEIWPLYQ